MKTRLLSIFAIATLALVSCKKTESAVPAEPGTATIEGILKAPIDLGNDTTASGVFINGYNNEFVPAGTQITAIVDSEDLQKDPQSGFTYEKLKFTTVVGANGEFSFTDIPCFANSIDVELRFNDFTAMQSQFDPSNNPPQNKIFTLSNKYVEVYDGAIVIKEYDYTAN
ncbi:MAG: hypothetical protein R3279_08235 [Putridiphycobacter sp.]|jgi:hypothetical protein|nr:hypothetical protein [Putridiphycobacter sp.]